MRRSQVSGSVRVWYGYDDHFGHLDIAISTHELHDTGGRMEKGVPVQEVQHGIRRWRLGLTVKGFRQIDPIWSLLVKDLWSRR